MHYCKKVLPSRKPAGSKYDHGVLLIVAGSPGMTGSATLASIAAIRCGCGMVHCAFPSSLLSILSVKLTEPVLHPLPDTNKGIISLDAVTDILELVEKMDALCIGPGLSYERSAIECVRKIVSNCKKPILLDADGVNAFKDNVEELKKHTGDLVITPHAGEWRRLFGELPSLPTERIAKVKKVAKEFNITILLKGNPTIICGSKGESFVMPYGNSALAKAGSGDVLSGIISSLIAQGASIIDATILGAYIHGKCGEILSEVKTEYSVLASDVAEAIPEILKTIVH
ncbi:MAG: NAD(P)H-hydrate dehydratase [Chitinispirillaceae bacterium]|nr:NAD(P)H-hydrate dehydratase [Chitinispirillaceae bacterium]